LARARSRQQCAGCVRRYAPIFERLLQDADFVAGGAALTYADVLLAGTTTGFLCRVVACPRHFAHAARRPRLITHDRLLTQRR
jgi:hypothetical protein